MVTGSRDRKPEPWHNEVVVAVTRTQLDQQWVGFIAANRRYGERTDDAALRAGFDAAYERITGAELEAKAVQLDLARAALPALDMAMSVIAVARQDSTPGDKINVAAILLPGVGKAIGIGADVAGVGGKVAGEAAEAAAKADGIIVTAANSAPLFKNLAPLNVIPAARLFPVSQIQRVGFSGRLDYVVIISGELVLGKSGHISLSGGADVLAAGEARFVKGVVSTIDNVSGHYRPSGLAAQSAAEAAFNRAGFNATGKYIEKGF